LACSQQLRIEVAENDIVDSSRIVPNCPSVGSHAKVLSVCESLSALAIYQQLALRNGVHHRIQLRHPPGTVYIQPHTLLFRAGNEAWRPSSQLNPESLTG
jgi:hypothetical protein